MSARARHGPRLQKSALGDSFVTCHDCLILPDRHRLKIAYTNVMALIGANELKKKMLIEVEGQPYNVTNDLVPH